MRPNAASARKPPGPDAVSTSSRSWPTCHAGSAAPAIQIPRRNPARAAGSSRASLAARHSHPMPGGGRHHSQWHRSPLFCVARTPGGSMNHVEDTPPRSYRNCPPRPTSSSASPPPWPQPRPFAGSSSRRTRCADGKTNLRRPRRPEHDERNAAAVDLGNGWRSKALMDEQRMPGDIMAPCGRRHPRCGQQTWCTSLMKELADDWN